jgi:hypothetical protein
MGTKVYKACVNYEISAYGESRKQQLMSLRKTLLGHKESSYHEAAVKFSEEAHMKKLEKVCVKSLSREKR